MSVNSGIQPTAALAKEFEAANAFGSSVRCVKVEIVDEELRSTQSTEIRGDEKEDYSNLYKILSSDIPAFLLFKQDNKKFRIIHYAPETASIKLKMVYSSSRAGLEKHLGSQFFIKTDFVDDIKQFSDDAEAPSHPFNVIKESDKPYSEKEKRLNEIDDLIKSSSILSKVTQSIKFGWNEDVTQALNGIVNGEHNFVQCVSGNKALLFFSPAIGYRYENRDNYPRIDKERGIERCKGQYFNGRAKVHAL